MKEEEGRKLDYFDFVGRQDGVPPKGSYGKEGKAAEGGVYWGKETQIQHNTWQISSFFFFDFDFFFYFDFFLLSLTKQTENKK